MFLAMTTDTPDIVIVDRRIEPEELRRLVQLFFEDMVKYVVDVERRLAAVGMLIADPSIRERVRDITFALIGRGEPLS